MTTLILVRHGQSLANAQKFFAGQTDAPLTSIGVEQAELTGRAVAKNYSIDRVYASDLQRAFRTASSAAEILELPVQPEQGLREINAGLWEGVAFEILMKRHAEDYRTWRENIGEARCTGGESVKELACRVEATLRRIAEENPGKTVLIGTHATPIRAMMSLVTTGSVEGMKDIPWVTNASFSELFYENGIWRFGLTSQDSHLAERITRDSANV